VFLQNRDELLAYFSKFSFFRTINAIDSVTNITHRVMELLRPKVFGAITYNNQELAENYIA